MRRHIAVTFLRCGFVGGLCVACTAAGNVSEEPTPPIEVDEVVIVDKPCADSLESTHGSFVEQPDGSWLLVTDHSEECMTMQSVFKLTPGVRLWSGSHYVAVCNVCDEVRWQYSADGYFLYLLQVTQKSMTLEATECPDLAWCAENPTSIAARQPTALALPADAGRKTNDGGALRSLGYVGSALDLNAPIDIRVYYPRSWSQSEDRAHVERLREVLCKTWGQPWPAACAPTEPERPFTDADYDMAYFDITDVTLPQPYIEWIRAQREP